MLSSRQAALITLERCEKDNAWASSVLDNVIKKESLERREASLAAALVFGVLQNRTYFDFLISCFCDTALNKLDRKVLNILRIGVCQLVSLDRIPPRAAVYETVSLCGVAGVHRASSLVNAVLRRVSEKKDDLPEVPGEGTASYLATRYSHPLWLSEYLISEKGYAFTESLFAANNKPVDLDIQVNSMRISRDEYGLKLLEEKIAFSIPTFPDSCISLAGGSVTKLPGYEDGLFYVQDRAARMAVEIAELKSGMRILDACASPGGKSFASAMIMLGQGDVIACDIHPKKLSLILDTASRLGLELIHTECRDARCFYNDFECRFDAVIADVPCSGIGVLRKKPEIRYKESAEISSLPSIQRDILNNLSRYVRPGGTLLYCTCTILREENENIVQDFLSSHEQFEPCDFKIGSSDSLNGCYTFYPNIDGTDGFFVSKLKRRAQ